ncbi:MAG: translation elongation factor Ts [Phycisphaerales bacterium]|nr:translation elongation factor Ts [Phycisphaerales bacterium]
MSITVTAADVNKLRQQTGAGMMDCRKALTESEGDFEKAIDYLRAKGQKVAANRSDRDAKEGVVIAKANPDGNYGIILNLSAETDFVSKNEDFMNFGLEVAELALQNMCSDIDAIKALPMHGATVGEKLLEMVAKIGEKIDITRYEQVNADAVVPYIHGNYRIGVLVGLNKAINENVVVAGKDVAMQIAAMNPLALDENSLSEETIAREKAIIVEQIMAEGKAADMAEKIAAGKLNRFFKDNTLLHQQFVKDNSKTVAEYVKSTEAGLEVVSFCRVAIGG